MTRHGICGCANSIGIRNHTRGTRALVGGLLETLFGRVLLGMTESGLQVSNSSLGEDWWYAEGWRPQTLS